MSILYKFYRPWDMKEICRGSYAGMPFLKNDCKIQLYPDDEKSIDQCFTTIISRSNAIKLQKAMGCNKSLFTDLMDDNDTDSIIIRIT